MRFLIPGFTKESDRLNKLLLNADKKWFLYDDIQYIVYGCFPNCKWNGGRVIFGEPYTKSQKLDIMNFYNNNSINMEFTFTNIMLQNKDYCDTDSLENLELANRFCVDICINDDRLQWLIHNKYPNLLFVKSMTKTDNNNDYYKIVLSYKMNNTKEIFNIENKSKYIVVINQPCDSQCIYEQKHYKIISDYQLGNIPEPFICPYNSEYKSDIQNLKNNSKFISNDKIIQYKDFYALKLGGRVYTTPLLLQMYLYYFIKSEYKDDMIKYVSEHINDYTYDILRLACMQC